MTSFEHDTVVPYQESSSKKQQVQKMFDSIAFRYDFLNRFLSAGIDTGWRKKAIRELKMTDPKLILDVATGTADVAIMCHSLLNPEKITGIDISEGMLALGRQKISKLGLTGKIELLPGDSETINFPDNTFDALTVAFGVRNFENLERGLMEMKRVLKPGGKMVILEFSKPSLPVISQLYQFYMNVFCPLIGKLFAKDKKAYQYLNESVKAFPSTKKFTELVIATGFNNVYHKPLTLGVCTIYCGSK
ncbi:MAG: ubiE [Chitinophagaceae bacterium]|nr:ubiE [Chitinophagaceae bacterium]